MVKVKFDIQAKGIYQILNIMCMYTLYLLARQVAVTVGDSLRSLLCPLLYMKRLLSGLIIPFVR